MSVDSVEPVEPAKRLREAVPAETVQTRPHGNPLQILLALLLGMRPKQWTKNLFVYIAVIFTGQIPPHDTQSWHNFGVATAAFLLFCLVSGSVYLMNDVADREQDKLHPEKSKRPIASGRLPWQLAAVAGVVFGAGGVAAAFLFNQKFGLITLAYLTLQVAYTHGLKHMVLLDVFAIALGFVLRAVAGAFAIGVPNSVWLLVCTLQLALFLGFGKRRHELVSLAEDASSHRRILSQYSAPFLDQLIAIVLGGLTVSYALYTINSPTAVAHPGLVITLPNVMYGIFRYLYLIHIEHKGGSPETILLHDRPMQVNLLLWLVEVVIALKIVR
jgi:4-hydroxybenzoate polyprenyltransferase